MNKEESIELINNIDTLNINDIIAGQQVDMVIKNQVLDIINQIDEDKPLKEPLGVLLVDMPHNAFWKFNYLYRGEDGEFTVDGASESTLLVKYGYKITEAEAKEKYPNFKWVSLEELEE